MKTALIVDDQVNVRRLICDYLSQEGFRVVEAADGRAALLQARREQPSVILLDIMMPEMSGFEFLRAYRREGSAPIILLTAAPAAVSASTRLAPHGKMGLTNRCFRLLSARQPVRPQAAKRARRR